MILLIVILMRRTKMSNKLNKINDVEFNLRDNADIVALAMEAAKSLDSTDLKKYFKKKLKLK